MLRASHQRKPHAAAAAAACAIARGTPRMGLSLSARQLLLRCLYTAILPSLHSSSSSSSSSRGVAADEESIVCQFDLLNSAVFPSQFSVSASVSNEPRMQSIVCGFIFQRAIYSHQQQPSGLQQDGEVQGLLHGEVRGVRGFTQGVQNQHLRKQQPHQTTHSHITQICISIHSKPAATAAATAPVTPIAAAAAVSALIASAAAASPPPDSNNSDNNNNSNSRRSSRRPRVWGGRAASEGRREGQQ
ncbi:hypothetical protein Emed_001939 [Eimeria media]